MMLRLPAAAALFVLAGSPLAAQPPALQDVVIAIAWVGLKEDFVR